MPVHFSNQEASPGLKRGGTLGVMLHTVLVACHADSIPEEIVIDLTGMEIGDAVRVSDIKLPERVTAVLDGDAVIASISAAKVAIAGEDGDAVEAEGEA